MAIPDPKPSGPGLGNLLQILRAQKSDRVAELWFPHRVRDLVQIPRALNFRLFRGPQIRCRPSTKRFFLGGPRDEESPAKHAKHAKGKRERGLIINSGDCSIDDWIARYEESHKDPVNRVFHTFGIPMIAVSIPLLLIAPCVRGFWKIAVGLFLAGWVFQFVGHSFEGKPPEFFKDWRFLLVGLRWWLRITQRARRSEKVTKVLKE